MNETIEVVITINKDDIFKFADKFGIKEWHYKDSKVSIDMTKMFDTAMTQVKDKPAASSASMF